MEYATKKMMEFQEQAFRILDYYPESVYKNSLKELVRYTTERTH